MGFVAGTLVHTDKGLVPIEQLKVGDMVLSKPESGQGEQAYKRVINTFKSAEKMPIVRVAFYQRDEVDYGEMYLFCTANHPFYSYDDKEWLAAIALTGNGGKIDKLVTDLHGRGLHIVNNTGYLIKISKRNVVIGRRYNYSPGTEEISYKKHRSLNMGLFSFVAKQFVDVIEWDNQPDGQLMWRFPFTDNEIQYGAQLTVRDGQIAIFVNEGQVADVFTAGLYKLETRTCLY
jgi:hypothetical protein